MIIWSCKTFEIFEIDENCILLLSLILEKNRMRIKASLLLQLAANRLAYKMDQMVCQLLMTDLLHAAFTHNWLKGPQYNRYSVQL
jgi:hypothetical protein